MRTDTSATARYVSLDDVLAAPPDGTNGRHPLPTPTDFARAFGDLGVADSDVVVAYDRAGGGFAGRLVWMLRIIGQPAALLDGGFGAWDGPVETGEPGVVGVERTGPVTGRPMRWRTRTRSPPTSSTAGW